MKENPIVSLSRKADDMKKQIQLIDSDIDEVSQDIDLESQVEYLELVNRRNQLEERLVDLEEKIAYLVELEERERNLNDVIVGAKVRLKSDSSEVEARVVDKFDSTGIENFISANSPLGRALLGKTVGEDFIVNTPTGDRSYKLLAVWG